MERNNVILYLGLAALLVVLILGCWHCSNVRVKTFVDAGYTKTTLPGEALAEWVKTENTNEREKHE
jgi:hypothetical protein